MDEEIIYLDGFDKAIAGIVNLHQSGIPIVVYHIEKCIDVLMEQGMTDEDAEEYFEFNVSGAYFGEGSPLFMHDESTYRDEIKKKVLGEFLK